MNTVIIDPNWQDEHGRIVTRNSTGVQELGVVVRMLEIESGEYWYGTVEKVDGAGKSFIKPLHKSSLGGWIEYEQNT